MTEPELVLIGDPVAQSLSPAIHAAAFAARGLDLRYGVRRVGRDELRPEFEVLRRRCLGLNVTTPLKEAIVPLLDEVADEARRAGSVNTVLLRDGVATGHSTDGAGFMRALGRVGAARPRRGVVFGTGGAARAVAAALTDAGARVSVIGRNEDAGRRLAADLEVSFEPIRRLAATVGPADLLVNATPLGGTAFPDACPVPDDVALPAAVTVFDLVYLPRRTKLLRRAEDAGCRTVEGIEMLVEQAALSFEVWTGLAAPLAEMRVAGHRSLESAAPPPRVPEGVR